ncbi:MAG: hypothetical protein WD492_00005, partial [Alkalispirochaeta sp.]
ITVRFPPESVSVLGRCTQRIGLQILGAIAIDAWSGGAAGWQTLNACSTVVIIDGVLILGPFLALIGTTFSLLSISEQVSDLR